MSSSPSHIPVFIHPAIKNLNVGQISKIIASKIIETTALQIQFSHSFCQQLGVAEHLNTYQAVAYFTDNRSFEKYGFNQSELIKFHEVYEEILAEFNSRVSYQKTV
ncbi:hypothetical protein GFH30_08035 [Acinetobacter wanghuae]|uniref:Uncharacterized protein n=1 Tax=Acinetobacter wanghuae TaxID=2662362 RepID=A0ABX6D1F6_9GAMM|nr:hypothetical protein [Acinetobacter wanghuae]QGA11347.1 hypothetical protein GFH30_08035 [Acinetobacter wanghuae]